LSIFEYEKAFGGKGRRTPARVSVCQWQTICEPADATAETVSDALGTRKAPRRDFAIANVGLRDSECQRTSATKRSTLRQEFSEKTLRLREANVGLREANVGLREANVGLRDSECRRTSATKRSTLRQEFSEKTLRLREANVGLRDSECRTSR